MLILKTVDSKRMETTREAKKSKIAFTTVFNGYDAVPQAPDALASQWHRVLVVDEPTHDDGGWDQIIVVSHDGERPDLLNRYYKWMSHKWTRAIGHFDHALYFDACITVTSEPSRIPFKVAHEVRRSVKEECEALNSQRHRWTAASIDRQYEWMVTQGFKDDRGLFLNGFFCREHSKTENELAEEVYSVCSTWTSRDMVALPYCMYKLDYVCDHIVPRKFIDRHAIRGTHKEFMTKVYDLRAE